MKTTTRSWLAMIVIGIFTIMANLDASIINRTTYHVKITCGSN